MMGTFNNVFAEHAWRYRDYLIDVFRKDKPFDRFVLEQIVGDQLPASFSAERAENIAAAGFLKLGDLELLNRISAIGKQIALIIHGLHGIMLVVTSVSQTCMVR